MNQAPGFTVGSFLRRGFLFAPVPEPASLTLLGIGIAGMAGYAWRRKRQRATV